MTQIDPIIAVKDVAVSSNWYQALLACKSKHGGNEFDVLVNAGGEIILCLHKWDEHDHPTMKTANSTAGNGLILYMRVKDLVNAWERAKELSAEIEEEIRLNPNSGKKEFALRDLDGYYLILSEYHEY